MKQKKPATGSNKKKKAEQLNLIVIVVLFTLLAVAFFNMMAYFVVPIILAITMTTLFYPMFKWLLDKCCFRNRTLAASVCCGLLVAGVFVPVYFVGHMVVAQSTDFYTSCEAWVNELSASETEFPPPSIKAHPLYARLQLDKIDWTAQFNEFLKSLGKWATMILNRTSASVFELLLGSFLTIFSLFYFFRDGERFIERARFLSPLRPHYETMIMARFVMVARAAIKGTVVIGLIQGVMGAILLLLLGFKTWLLWGVVMIILSIIPIVGSYFVLIPTAIYLFWTGHIAGGIICVVVATLLNYGVDYLLRPKLVGRDAKVHDLIILFSTLGGMAVFGVMGFVVGPVIAVLFVTMIDIYAKEFKKPLMAANRSS